MRGAGQSFSSSPHRQGGVSITWGAAGSGESGRLAYGASVTTNQLCGLGQVAQPLWFCFLFCKMNWTICSLKSLADLDSSQREPKCLFKWPQEEWLSVTSRSTEVRASATWCHFQATRLKPSDMSVIRSKQPAGSRSADHSESKWEGAKGSAFKANGKHEEGVNVCLKMPQEDHQLELHNLKRKIFSSVLAD